MKYIQIIYYITRIKIKTNKRIMQIILESIKNTGCHKDYITDGWLWSVLKRKYENEVQGLNYRGDKNRARTGKNL